MKDGDGPTATRSKPRKSISKPPRKQEKPLNLAGYRPEDVLRRMMATPPPRQK
jgi:hypothetical protein